MLFSLPHAQQINCTCKSIFFYAKLNFLLCKNLFLKQDRDLHKKIGIYIKNRDLHKKIGIYIKKIGIYIKHGVKLPTHNLSGFTGEHRNFRVS